MSSHQEKIDYLNEVDKYIILLLGAKKGEPVKGPLWLQKEMFVIQDLYPELGEETDFEPYFLGPHSEIVQNEAEELRNSKFIDVVNRRFQLSKKGKEVFNILKHSYEDKLPKILEFKEILNDLERDELLAFIYFSYPSPEELEKESIEYKELLPKREKLAVSLYLKDKISAQKAAQIAGKDIDSFLEKLKTVV